MNIRNKITAFFTAFITAVSSTIFPVMSFAENVSMPVDSELTAQMQSDYYDTLNSEPYVQKLSYSDYYDKYSGENRPDDEIAVCGTDYISHKGSNFSVGSCGESGGIKDNVLLWKNSGGELTYSIDVEKTGIYCVNMSYCPIKSTADSIELSMSIDGEIPFDTAERITLNRVWINEHDIYADSKGNQIRPPQIQTEMWQKSDFKDSDGLFNEPLIFYLEQGKHQITFTSEKADFAIEYFKFYNSEPLSSYTEYVNSVNIYAAMGNSASNIIRLEGENALYKSSPTLYPTYDNTSYLASPSNPRKIVYNTLGGGSWKKSGQTAVWKISAQDISFDGWYKIGIKARQNEMRGLYSNRRIYIDGKVPCAELNQVKFYYDKDWNVVSPKTADGDYIYVYLTADCDHTISLEAVPGEIGESMRKLDSIVSELNTYYRKILMVTEPNPDKYTDYYVHEKVPDLLTEFEKLSSELKTVQSEIEKLSDSSGSEAAALERMTVILDKCIDKPLKIPQYLSQIKDNITSISAWMRDYRDQPLEVDYIELASADKSFSSTDEKFLKSLKFGVSSFIGSFFEDYTTLSDIKGEDAINVWVSQGRDRAQIIRQLTESEFMKNYDIPVSVNLVSGGIVEAVLAGKGPDVALFIGGEFPVNLASRGQLVNLSEFDDFDEVKQRFQQNAMTNYEYNGGTYGLPVSQVWPMMFYRKDILSELGYANPPETWDDLLDMLPAIQRNYMSVGLVLPSANISPATESGHTFAMLLLQQGLNYYNEDATASSFNSVEAVAAFEMWTDFYTKFSFVQSYDAFSRFRTGEYPIVISNYTFYNQLSAASPEIRGLWSFTSVPGTEQSDGTISHAANSNGTAAVIFNKVKNKDAAWEFVKWFTSDDIQAEYAVQLEGLLGTIGRFETANTNALKRLSWSKSELEALEAQRSELEEIPVMPYSYAVTRNIMNAFREVVNKGKNPRDTFLWYNNDINEEIARKRRNMRD